MRTRSRGRLGLLTATAATVALAMLAPTWAAAEPGVQPPWAVGGTVEGPPPPEALAELDACPAPSDFPAGFNPFICLTLSAYDGELKLGDTVATVDGPLELTVGVGLNQSFESVIVPGPSAGGGPASVPISGGILGIPALDPILALDPLGLLSVSATPQIGAAGVNGGAFGAFAFLGWLLGEGDETGFEANLALPLSIKLNNLLFGPDCTIPEFTVNLTSGTTVPPEGVEPLTGSDGTTVTTTYTEPTFSLWATKAGAELVGNDFAVPAPEDCDLLQPLDSAVDQLDSSLLGGTLAKLNLGTDKGLFDPVIGKQVGLPSAAGNNYAKFKVDTLTTRYDLMLDADLTTSIQTGSNTAAFPVTTVGSTSTATATITNNGIKSVRPTLTLSHQNSPHYSMPTDGCSGTLLQPGESCDATFLFHPTTASNQTGHIAQLQMENAGSHSIVIFGVAVDPPPSSASLTSTASAPAPAPAAVTPAKKCPSLLGIKLGKC